MIRIRATPSTPLSTMPSNRFPQKLRMLNSSSTKLEGYRSKAVWIMRRDTPFFWIKKNSSLKMEMISSTSCSARSAADKKYFFLGKYKVSRYLGCAQWVLSVSTESISFFFTTCHGQKPKISFREIVYLCLLLRLISILGRGTTGDSCEKHSFVFLFFFLQTSLDINRPCLRHRWPRSTHWW